MYTIHIYIYIYVYVSMIMFIVSFLFLSIWILNFISKNVVLVWRPKPMELIQLHQIHQGWKMHLCFGFVHLFSQKLNKKKLFNYGKKKKVNSFYKQVAFFFWRKWCFFLANYSWSCWIEKNMYLTCSLWQRDFVGTNLSEKICFKKKISGISPPILSPGILSETLFEAT